MNLLADDVARALAEGEGRELELKRGLPPDARCARTLCAFANTRGGLLLIGVGDRGELVGAPRPQATLARLRALAAERLVPPLVPRVGVVALEGRRIVWCSVPSSALRPHARLDEHDEREYVVRVGASNRRASAARLAAIRAQRASAARLDELERRILGWVEARARQPAHTTTVALCARELELGRQRARRAFGRLEFAGRLTGLGKGARRFYALP